MSKNFFHSAKRTLREIHRERLDARGLPAIGRRLYPKGVAFVHVPKCAGRSVERGLRRAYRWSRAHTHAGATFDHAAKLFGKEIESQGDRQAALETASRHRTAIYTYHLSLGIRCITGHAPVNSEILHAYASSHVFVTVLRDPVERFLSHFKYSYRSGGHGSIDVEFEEFMESDRARTFGSMYQKYFAHEVPAASADSKIRACLENFGAIGFIDDMLRFERDLREVTGRRISIPRVNVAAANEVRSPGSVNAIDHALRCKVERICAPDIEIYEWARSRFAR